jgi:hypothetical protein
MRQGHHLGAAARGERFSGKFRAAVAGLALLSALPAGAAGAEQAPVSRAEYDALMKQMSALQKQVAELQSQQAATAKAVASAPAGGTGGAAASGKTTGKTFDSLQGQIDEVKSIADIVNPGDTRFVIAGSASSTFSTFSNTPSNFGATFAPIFLWQLNDKLLVESELELELENADTIVNLEYVDISYELNDYMTVDAGKFLNPMNIFVERYEPSWINKLPDTPLAIYDGILPESNVGVQVRGGIPIGPSRVKYAAYVSNAPSLIADDSEAAGQLQFDNFTSLSDYKAYGGRIGLEIIPGVEAGYGLQYANVTANTGGVGSTSSFLQSVDLEVKRDSPALKGSFTLLGQYAWSRVGDITYDPNGDLGFGPTNFPNNRSGGYLQLSYRPKRLSDFLNRFEFIVRGDMADAPSNAPGGFNERRLTLGVDYWLTSFTALKAAYELDQRSNGEPNQNGFLLQIATGL